ncbi:hypothetical protein [Sulfurimonas marina]|uniref:Uncharacterized protein n=1 Tax=Sulfurimonas marina TaxID=2590551 RepID=A0A7M1AWW3_9BACT|nr:hypothetical protein [Sulfurimonas marina]QOP41806.1 hypothetical protein FJR03_08690 [Sulfurimonas marina]
MDKDYINNFQGSPDYDHMSLDEFLTFHNVPEYLNEYMTDKNCKKLSTLFFVSSMISNHIAHIAIGNYRVIHDKEQFKTPYINALQTLREFNNYYDEDILLALEKIEDIIHYKAISLNKHNVQNKNKWLSELINAGYTKTKAKQIIIELTDYHKKNLQA